MSGFCIIRLDHYMPSLHDPSRSECLAPVFCMRLAPMRVWHSCVLHPLLQCCCATQWSSLSQHRSMAGPYLVARPHVLAQTFVTSVLSPSRMTSVSTQTLACYSDASSAINKAPPRREYNVRGCKVVQAETEVQLQIARSAQGLTRRAPAPKCCFKCSGGDDQSGFELLAYVEDLAALSKWMTVRARTHTHIDFCIVICCVFVQGLMNIGNPPTLKQPKAPKDPSVNARARTHTHKHTHPRMTMTGCELCISEGRNQQRR